MRLALEFAFEAERLDVIFVELALGDVAVIALDLLLGLELGAEVGRLALAALAMLAWPVFTLVVGAAGAAPDVLAHPAIDLVFRFRALRHRDSSCMSVRVQRGTRPPLRPKSADRPSAEQGLRPRVRQTTNALPLSRERALRGVLLKEPATAVKPYQLPTCREGSRRFVGERSSFGAGLGGCVRATRAGAAARMHSAEH